MEDFGMEWCIKSNRFLKSWFRNQEFLCNVCGFRMSFLCLILAEFNWEEEHEIRGRFSQTRTAMLRSV